MGSERRKARRTEGKLGVSFVSHKDGTIDAVNFSSHGVLCTVTAYVPVMTELDTKLCVPTGEGERTIHCRSIVVRIEPEEPDPKVKRYQIACYFAEIEEADRVLLERYVERQVGWK